MGASGATEERKWATPDWKQTWWYRIWCVGKAVIGNVSILCVVECVGKETIPMGCVTG